ncbi:MAG TPA: hypothetical protein VFM18_16140 [Methanosarcina sp.]|nr:hypothetical protein [Methanosarcina sp.]
MNKQYQVRKLLSGLDIKWSSFASKLYTLIIDRLAKGDTPLKAVKSAFDKYNVEQVITESTINSILKAAALGIGKPQSFAVRSNKGITSKVLAQSYDGNKTELSARIHSNVVMMKSKITNMIKRSIADGDSVKKTASKLFDGYGYGQIQGNIDIANSIKKIADLRIAGVELDKNLQNEIKSLSRRVNRLRTEPLKASYNQLLKSIEKGVEKQIEKNLYFALQEKSRYHANMIARTESARAYFAAFESKSVLDPDVSGVKVSLSSSHKIFDICDVHASIDLGYGPGVYPLSKLPRYPLHPHCFCQLTQVYLNKIPENAKVSADQIDKSMQEYLDSLSEQEAVALLGLDGYAQYIEYGTWKGSLRNYSGFHAAKSVLRAEDFE